MTIEKSADTAFNSINNLVNLIKTEHSENEMIQICITSIQELYLDAKDRQIEAKHLHATDSISRLWEIKKELQGWIKLYFEAKSAQEESLRRIEEISLIKKSTSTASISFVITAVFSFSAVLASLSSVNLSEKQLKSMDKANEQVILQTCIQVPANKRTSKCSVIVKEYEKMDIYSTTN